MYKFLTKHGTALAMGIGALVTLIFVVSVILGLSGSGYDTGTDLMAVNYKEISAFNLGLYLTILLGAVALLLMLGGVVMDLFSNRKSSMKMILGIVALIIIFIILYSISNYDTGGKWDALNSEFGVAESSSKFISAGILTCGLLLVLASLSIVVSEVRNLFK